MESAQKNSSITYHNITISLPKSYNKNYHKLDSNLKRTKQISYLIIKISKIYQYGSKITPLSLLIYSKSHKYSEIGKLDSFISHKNRLAQVKDPLINLQWSFKLILFSDYGQDLIFKAIKCSTLKLCTIQTLKQNSESPLATLLIKIIGCTASTESSNQEHDQLLR